MTRSFTRKEVEERNHKDNAAIIIDNVVYDVTRFLEDHPGGVEVLLDNAGKDASRCFRDVGHSDDAKLWRSEFKIGEVVKEEQWEILCQESETTQGRDELTLAGLLNVWLPPLALAALAIVAYIYLF
ncbi:cytochrome b5-like [Vanessa cardui]|uniref:cytochrome b5-like n=1 Tax=Vanessa cardui TaxID=171605 RepID=UPI001F13C8A7|nr:cytochrome b5-like [Vanessa cardui]